MTTLVVLNPAAKGGAAARYATPLRELVAARDDWTLVVTTSAEEASALVASCSDEVRLVVAVGGDGTVNEAVNGLMRRDPSSRPALAVVPAGSGNDFPNLLGVPKSLAAAMTVAATGRRIRIDIGKCNDRWFANAVSLGLDAQVAARATEIKAATGRSGFGLYFSALMAVLAGELKTYEVGIGYDGEEPRRRRCMLVAAGNGRTYGGGFKVLPDADPSDGLLDTIELDEIGLAEVLWRLPFFVFGRHTRMRPVHMGRHTSIVVTSADPMPGQVDGEILASARYEIRVEPSALEVVVPG